MRMRERGRIRACVKARLPDEPDYLDQQKTRPRKLHVECTSDLGR